MAEKAEFLERTNLQLLQNYVFLKNIQNDSKKENNEIVEKLKSEIDGIRKLLNSKEIDLNFLKYGIIQDLENSIYVKLIVKRITKK